MMDAHVTSAIILAVAAVLLLAYFASRGRR